MKNNKLFKIIIFLWPISFSLYNVLKSRLFVRIVSACVHNVHTSNVETWYTYSMCMYNRQSKPFLLSFFSQFFTKKSLTNIENTEENNAKNRESLSIITLYTPNVRILMHLYSFSLSHSICIKEFLAEKLNTFRWHGVRFIAQHISDVQNRWENIKWFSGFFCVVFLAVLKPKQKKSFHEKKVNHWIYTAKSIFLSVYAKLQRTWFLTNVKTTHKAEIKTNQF